MYSVRNTRYKIRDTSVRCTLLAWALQFHLYLSTTGEKAMIDAAFISNIGKQLNIQGLDGVQAIPAGEAQLTDINKEIFSKLFTSQLIGDLGGENAAMPGEELAEQPAWQLQSPTLPHGNELPPELLNVAAQTDAPVVVAKLQMQDGLNEQVIKNTLKVETDANPTGLKDLLPVAKVEVAKQIISQKQTPVEIIPMLQEGLEQTRFDKSIDDLPIGKSNETLLAKIAETNSNTLKLDTQHIIQPDNKAAPLSNLQQSNPIVDKPTPSTQPANLTLNVPMNQPSWGEAMAGKISWMIMENQQSAKINLNPAELGPIEVKLNMNNDQATISFVAQHTEARDALEQAFPKLRDMLSQSGINLGESNVSAQSQDNSTDTGAKDGVVSDDSHKDNEGISDLTEAGMTQTTHVTNGLVDHYV